MGGAVCGCDGWLVRKLLVALAVAYAGVCGGAVCGCDGGFLGSCLLPLLLLMRGFVAVLFVAVMGAF